MSKERSKSKEQSTDLRGGAGDDALEQLAVEGEAVELARGAGGGGRAVVGHKGAAREAGAAPGACRHR